MLKEIRKGNVALGKNGITTMVDPETGEIFDEVASNGTRTWMKYQVYEEVELTPEMMLHETIPFNSKACEFLKLWRGLSMRLYKNLTPTELHVMIGMIDFVSYGDCVLRERGVAYGNVLTVKDLAEKLGRDKESLRKILLSLQKKQVITFHDKGVVGNPQRMISFNPYIYCRGHMVERWVVDFYSNSYWNINLRGEEKEIEMSQKLSENP